MIVGRIYLLLLLLAISVAGPTHAYYINPAKVAAVDPEKGKPKVVIRKFTSSLFAFAPFQGSPQTAVPGFADPIGMGIDTRLKLFSGNVHFMDLLGDYSGVKIVNHTDVELPPGVVQPNTLLSNYNDRFFGGKIRAMDNSLLNLKKAKSSSWLGLPVTTETSPLSLVGYGTVSEYYRPVRLPVPRCPDLKQRMRVREDVPRNVRNRIQPPPELCYDI